MSLNWLLERKKISPKAIKEVILKQSHNAKRLAHTKVRSEVELSNRKLYKQKGTGRARRGSAGASILVGGGQAHGPRYHITNIKLNKKVARGVRLDILRRHVENNNMIIKEIKMDQIKTQMAQNILNEMQVDIFKTRTVIIINGQDNNIKKSFANIRNIKINDVNNINTVQVFNAHKVIITPDAVNTLTNIYGEQNA